MGRKVKCQDTGEESTNDVAYKAANGKYYSSEAAYNAIVEKQRMRNMCVQKIRDMTNYGNEFLLPTLVNKKLKDFEPYGYDVVYETMLRKQSDIEWFMANKRYESESQKMMYMFAIVQNNLMDVYREFEAMRNAKKKVSQIEFVSEEDLQIGSTKKKSSNVGSILGDI